MFNRIRPKGKNKNPCILSETSPEYLDWYFNFILIFLIFNFFMVTFVNKIQVDRYFYINSISIPGV